jgi:DNA-binding NtrC family response regulator
MSTTIYTREELIHEFKWTWGRHRGRTSIAAEILGIKENTLERALSRARKDGVAIEFTTGKQDIE